MVDSLELYHKLDSLNLLAGLPQYWWDGYGSSDIIIGTILTQNASWERVLESIDNLKKHNLLELENLAECDRELLMELIRPSGLYKAKSNYLINLAKNIISEFGDFEYFKSSVTREWLLSQKGIGLESADSILCYGCGRAVMVVDSYSAKLLNAIGYEFENYDDLQHFFHSSMDGAFEDMALVYARYHGMIVEFMKLYKKGKTVDISALNL